MSHPPMYDESDPLLARVREIALALPDAAEKVSHGHPAFFTTKVFAYYGGSLRSASGTWVQHPQSVLVLLDLADRMSLSDQPDVYVPGYLGPSGWLGIDLDAATDWSEIAALITDSYRLTAGSRRVARLEG